MFNNSNNKINKLYNDIFIHKRAVNSIQLYVFVYQTIETIE